MLKKKILSIITIGIISIGLCGCVYNTDPKMITSDFFSNLKEYNIAKPMMLMVQSENGSTGTNGDSKFSGIDFQDKTTNDYLKSMLTNMEYKIESVDTKGSEAAVKAEVKTVDVETLMKNAAMEKAQAEIEKQVKAQVEAKVKENPNMPEAAKEKMESQIKAAAEEKLKSQSEKSETMQDMSKLSDKELKEMQKSVVETINNTNNLPKKTSKVSVKLVKEEGEWKIKPTDELMKVIFGGK